ncbi:hypothetical protein PRIPAC_77676 [Pristionchus pacificus]|nr:hypothetical protein PRIPAC_77676 [Pristionchus pacificus]
MDTGADDDTRSPQSPHCIHCGNDVREILRKMLQPAPITRVDIEAARWIDQIKSCHREHYVDPPAGEINYRGDNGLPLYFVSNEMDKEKDQDKKEARIQLYMKWKICLMEHGERESENMCDNPWWYEMSYRLERVASTYDQELHGDGMSLIDETSYSIRDHRPICVCRTPIDLRSYINVLGSISSTTKCELRLKKRLFGASKRQEDRDVEELSTSLRRGIDLSSPLPRTFAENALLSTHDWSSSFNIPLPSLSIVDERI